MTDVLTISDLTYDEELAFNSTDSDSVTDPDSNVSSLSSDLTTAIAAARGYDSVTHLNDLALNYYSAPTDFPQHAEITNFVSSSQAGVTSYFLASDSGGDSFSTTSGVQTDLKVGSDIVYLFGTSDPNVVVGRIGNDPAGAVALVIALDGNPAHTALGVDVYAPLYNSDGTKVDDLDTLNLSGKIFLGYDFNTTSTSNFDNFGGVHPGELDFAMVAASSGNTTNDVLITGYNDLATDTTDEVTVSQQGLGVGAQNIGQTDALRLDFVTGGTIASGSDTGLHYSNHIDVIAADFTITQVNPTGKLATITVYAFHTSTDAQTTTFRSDALSNEGAARTITPGEVTIYDTSHHDVTSTFMNAGLISQNGDGVQIAGLPNNYEVAFTTGNSVADSFNRVVVENTGSAKNLTFDVGPIHMTSITGGTGSGAQDLGPHLVFEDGGPSVGLTTALVPTVQVDESSLNTPSLSTAGAMAGLFSITYGPDGQGSLSYKLGVGAGNENSGLIDTATGQQVLLNYDAGTNTVVGTVTINSTATTVLTISVDSTGHVVLDQARAVVHGTASNGDTSESTSSWAAGLVTLTATATDGDGDSASNHVDISSAFSILDDGPQSLGSGLDVTIGNNLSANPTSPALPDTASGHFTTFNAGNDGVGSYVIRSYDPNALPSPTYGGPDTTGDWTWAYALHQDGSTDFTKITETYTDPATHVASPIFSLSLDSGTGQYTATMISPLPDSKLPLDANKIHAAGPTSHTLDVGVVGTSGDDVLITSSPGPINASNGNVGVANGNLDPSESLTFNLYTDMTHTTAILFHGIDIGTKTAQSATYYVTGQIHGGGTFLAGPNHDGYITLGKNGTISADAGNLFLDSITVTDVNGSAVKVGISTINLLIPPADVGFHFGATLTDGDGDYVSSHFAVFIDGNNNGLMDSNLTYPV